MRILLLFLLPLVAADCSKDTQNSQYSRTRNGEEEIKLFEGSHIGKMGGNFQASPNIDTLAQRQMKGLAMTISQLGLDPHAIENGPVSDESGKSGSVYSLASARGSWKSGNSRNQGTEVAGFRAGGAASRLYGAGVCCSVDSSTVSQFGYRQTASRQASKVAMDTAGGRYSSGSRYNTNAYNYETHHGETGATSGSAYQGSTRYNISVAGVREVGLNSVAEGFKYSKTGSRYQSRSKSTAYEQSHTFFEEKKQRAARGLVVRTGLVVPLTIPISVTPEAKPVYVRQNVGYGTNVAHAKRLGPASQVREEDYDQRRDYGSDTYVQMNGWGETTYINYRDSSKSHQEKLSSGSSGVRYIPGSTVGPVTDVGGIARNRDKLGSEGQGSTMYNSGSRVAFTGRNYGASETYGESQLRRYKREIVGETYEAGTTRNKRYRKTGTFPWIFSNGTFDLRGGLIFCCQDDEQVVTTPKPLQRLQIPKGNNGVRISEQKCLEYSRRFCNTAIGCAGGGRPVRILGKYPHMAAVGWRKTDGSGFLWDCGGSLLSENYVLTAAHCTYHTAGGFVSERPDTVRLGELDFSIDDTAFQDIRIESIIMHPEYKSPSKYHDLALLKLATSARLTNYIRPVCLWQNETITRNIGHAMGWGSTSYLGNRSEVLQEVEISFYTNEECRESFGLSRTLERGVIPEQLCAGHPAGGRDTCKGDSGGPLTVGEEGYCILVCVHHQVGITSFGKGCGSTIPAIYTRISSYLDWIEGVVWQ